MLAPQTRPTASNRRRGTKGTGMADEFEVIVVGGGTAGLTAALAARHEGASVALVEREERIGGDCTFYGCVPSKALIEIAQTVFDARRLAADGILESVPAPS